MVQELTGRWDAERHEEEAAGFHRDREYDTLDRMVAGSEQYRTTEELGYLYYKYGAAYRRALKREGKA